MRELTQRARRSTPSEIVFGHTHRPGPLPRDQRMGARLFNTGSWLYEPEFAADDAGESPYWPGRPGHRGGRGPPELRRTLDDLPL